MVLAAHRERARGEFMVCQDINGRSAAAPAWPSGRFTATARRPRAPAALPLLSVARELK
jgi:hypothetical protein